MYPNNFVIGKIHQEFKKNKVNPEGKKIQQFRKACFDDIETFWAGQANNLLWYKKWDKTLEWNYPFAKWFVGGELNASVNCLDRHINTDKKNKPAIIYEGENGIAQTYTYYQLYLLTNQFADALKKLGIKKGDRITIYLPVIPELIISMLACARIGVIHVVVFSGFSSQALSDRVNDSESRLIITADYAIRRGKKIPLKKVVDQIMFQTPSIENVIVLKRGIDDVTLYTRDLLWDKLLENTKKYCEPEKLESTHPLYILYTSGTTGKPKGVLHSTAGYLTYLYSTARWVFNFNSDDIFFCTADIGWVTGHSYMVYAPLLHGVTEIIYEGAPDFPKPDKYWNIIEKHNATILYTTPTALRMYMKYGNEIPNSFDLSSLRLLGTVGEPINPNVWMWYFKIIGKEKCYIVDTWWQTETGGIMISSCPGIDSISMKPGSASLPLPGIDLSIVDESGNMVNTGNKGYLIIKKPWPGMLMTVWKDNDKYCNTYWNKFKGYYYSGDFAVIDEDNYVWLLGRSDDVLKVAGHRLGTIELESAFVSHHAIAEAAITSKLNEKKGDSIIAFLVLKNDYVKSTKLSSELIEHIRNTIGSIAIPDEIYFVNSLPKTRSGKIMRRLLKAIVSEDGSIGDVSTIEDDTSIDEIKKIYYDMKKALK